MASSTTPVNTENMLVVQYDFSEVFLGDNTFEKATLINISGSAQSLSLGTVLGRISASGKVTLRVSTATDGSQYPIGILASATVSIANNGETNVSVCDFGQVASDKLVFSGSETLSTVLGGRQMRDLIPSLSRGIKLIASTELTAHDNA